MTNDIIRDCDIPMESSLNKSWNLELQMDMSHGYFIGD